jgi:hypothetical protein
MRDNRSCFEKRLLAHSALSLVVTRRLFGSCKRGPRRTVSANRTVSKWPLLAQNVLAAARTLDMISSITRAFASA